LPASGVAGENRKFSPLQNPLKKQDKVNPNGFSVGALPLKKKIYINSL
jgi:hypothetical protein